MNDFVPKAVGLQACVSLLLAFALAPFQHVHTHDGRGAVVHAHFYALAHVHFDIDADTPGAHFDDVDDHAAAKSLDTFLLQIPPAFAPFVLAQTQTVEPMLAPASAPCETTEACAHDPPSACPSIPRAPPS